MRKQVLKGLSMFMGLMTIALGTAVATAHGQSSGSVRANVPFEFVVGSRTLPAGEYTVRSINQDALKIASKDANDSAIRLSRVSDGETDHAKLVFHRYGERYFLAEVWSSYDEGRTLATSKEERSMQKESSRIASTQPVKRAFETVEVAIALNQH